MRKSRAFTLRHRSSAVLCMVLGIVGCTQGSYIVGGNRQVDTDLSSSAVNYVDDIWGFQSPTRQLFGLGWYRTYPTVASLQCTGTDASSCQVVEGQVTVDQAAYGWGYFVTDPRALGASKVAGGRELVWNLGAGKQDAVLTWGDLTVPGGQEVEFYSSLAYNNNPGSGGWQDGYAKLYLVSATSSTGYLVVGAIQRARDEESKQPWVTLSQWGATTSHEQVVAIGKAWSKEYGWGFSTISLYLSP